MAIALKTQTEVINIEKHEVHYERKSFWIFSWYERVSSKKVSDDLVIFTDKDYDKIYLQHKNGVAVELIQKQ